MLKFIHQPAIAEWMPVSIGLGKIIKGYQMPPSLRLQTLGNRCIRYRCNADSKKIIPFSVNRNFFRQKNSLTLPHIAILQRTGIGINYEVNINANLTAIVSGHPAKITSTVKCQGSVHTGKSGRSGAVKNFVQQVERFVFIYFSLNVHHGKSNWKVFV